MAAQPLFERALALNRRLLMDDHPYTARSFGNLAYNLYAQRKYSEARDRWLSAVKSADAGRLRLAFAGLERAGAAPSVRPALSIVLARLGQPTEAWQALEEDKGRVSVLFTHMLERARVVILMVFLRLIRVKVGSDKSQLGLSVRNISGYLLGLKGRIQ